MAINVWLEPLHCILALGDNTSDRSWLIPSTAWNRQKNESTFKNKQKGLAWGLNLTLGDRLVLEPAALLGQSWAGELTNWTWMTFVRLTRQ
jgi:hypothetical protein